MPKELPVCIPLNKVIRSGVFPMLLVECYVTLKSVVPSTGYADAVRIFKKNHDITEEELDERSAVAILYRFDGKEMKGMTKIENDAD